MRRILPTVAFALIAPAALYSQSTTSSLTGTVTDSSGAVLGNATVTVTNVATGVAQQVTTGPQGTYRVGQLPPGNYSMKVESTGFQEQNLENINLVVDQQGRQDVKLEVGGSVQTVTVSGSQQLLDTVASNQGQVISNKQIIDLPLNGRDFLQLAQLSAGVSPSNINGMNSPASAWTGTQTVSISVAGLREDDTSYLFDGIESRNAWYGAIGILPSIDNIQEFKIEQVGSTAAYGNAGTFVNVVSRSGANQLHGTAFEFLRNNALDARNYFDVGAAPAFHQNQFGGSVGGPIKRNKMFFFLNYEGFRETAPTTVFNRVPTLAERNGDFSASQSQYYSDPTCNTEQVKGSNCVPVIRNPLAADPTTTFAGNQIPAALFSPAALKALAFFPAPNGSFSGGNNYVNVQDTLSNWDQGSARIDYTISQKDTVFGRYTQETLNSTEPGLTFFGGRIFPSHPKNLATGWTHVFNSSLVNNVRFGWNYTETGQNRAAGYDTTQANPLGLDYAEIQPGSFGPPSIGLTGYANPGSAGGTEVIRENLFMGTDTLLLQRGKNTASVGADIRYDPVYMYEDWQGSNLSFNGNYTGNVVADALIGAPSSAATSVGDPTLNLRRWYQSYFAQDTYQLMPKLTVNGGIRYEYNQPPVDTANHVGSFDFATGTLLTYPDTSALGLGRQMVHPVYTNISPRLGFNFSPDQNTVIKGGFGMYWLAANLNQLEVMVDTPKYYSVQSYNNSIAGQPLNFKLDQLFNLSLPGAGQSVSFINANNKTPLAYEYSLSVQRNFATNWLAEVSYIGSLSRHYETRIVINPLRTDNTTAYPNYQGAVQENLNAGSSNYNALAVRVEKRYSNGLSVLGSYTYSKCLGTPWQDQFAWHPLDLSADYGHCTYDQNQRLSANAVYELPFGKGKMFLNRGGFLNQIAGGWQGSAIATFYTGPWLTLGSGQNLGAFVNQLPLVSGPVNNGDLHSGLGRHGRLGPYFNTSNVQAITATGVQGNAGVSNVETPGSAVWDLSAFKTWTVLERYGLTFRGDFFNAFNRVNFVGLDTGVNDSNFGNLTGANPAREIQVSARVRF